MELGPVNFEGLGLRYYRSEGRRKPRKGEFYLSGAIPAAYRAPADLMTEYRVVVPTRATKAMPPSRFAPAAP